MTLVPESYRNSQGITSFTGADIKAVAAVDGKLKSFGELQTISYSVHREKSGVLTLGRVNPLSFTRGPRCIAGSMVFTVFNREVLEEITKVYPDDPIDGDFGSILVDQIPPFNVTITFLNEDGFLSSLVIYGIDIVDDGQVMSVNDMIIENVKGYKARGLDLMWMAEDGVWHSTSSGQRKLNSKAIFTMNPNFGQDFALSPNKEALEAYKSALFSISQLRFDIKKIETEIARLQTTTYADKQNQIDRLQQQIYINESKIRTLERESRQMRVLINFSNRSSVIDKYLEQDRT